MDVKIEQGWKEQLKGEFEKPYFEQLTAFVREEYQEYPGSVFPKAGQIFRAFDACPFDKVKVVMLGQDPYPTRGHAHGLCFSVESNVRPLPKSLKNIYTEIESDLKIQCPEDGDLNRWAEQGVLMLNAVLTVREGQPGSHANKGWELFTDAVIRILAEKRSGLVYMLWGSYAQKKAHVVDAENNLIIRSPHPSPLSAYRGFYGSKPFSQANAYLESTGQTIISW
jgi:uracil-DNA glycosylase